MSPVYALKNLLKSLLPDSLLLLYHQTLASFGAAWYRHPSRSMVVVGVTGTKGKTSVVHLIAHILMYAGRRVGFTTGVTIRVGKTTWPNTMKMTMPGRFKLQQLLRRMVDAGCEYALVETTSEGIKQHRHRGIEYDIAVVTNISPEHIESHGSFEAYLSAKGKLVATLAGSPKKTIEGKSVPKVKVLNADDPHHEFFERFFADTTARFSMNAQSMESPTMYVARQVQSDSEGSTFIIRDSKCRLPMIGTHNVYNALAAIAVCHSLGIPWHTIIESLASAHGAPGRMEEIPTNRGFRVFTDYAHEPASLRALYEALRLLYPKRLIVVLGSQGGGRDISKRSVMGSLAGEYADVVFVTNEDPYDEDPQAIIDDVIHGVVESEKKSLKSGANLFSFSDRKEAIEKALSLAEAGDIVCISGKGGELVMAVEGGRHIPWDDAAIIRDWLNR